jgi:uncharacterized protein (DUF305 family)
MVRNAVRLAAVLAVVTPFAAGAQMQVAQVQGMQMGQSTAPDTPATTAYKAAMAKMDQGMAVPYSGDADQDFVAGMIPHHQGAIDMAEVELRYGRDPALKKLARDIIAAQREEIAFMEKWQAKYVKK